MIDSAPITIPGYFIREKLGKGSSSVVYLAVREDDSARVAIKILDAPESSGFRERFRAETAILRSLRHPNLVRLIGAGESGRTPYIVLEYVPGGELSTRLASGPLLAVRAARLVAAAAEGVHAAHLKGVVHRDLKPSNILLTRRGEPKVSDFGMARLLSATGRRTPFDLVVGTMHYMAPEQALGDRSRIGPAVDVFSLGVTLFECLVGRPPWRETDFAKAIDRIADYRPISPLEVRPSLPKPICEVCRRAIEKRPEDRPESAKALADLLNQAVAESS